MAPLGNPHRKQNKLIPGGGGARKAKYEAQLPYICQYTAQNLSSFVFVLSLFLICLKYGLHHVLLLTGRSGQFGELSLNFKSLKLLVVSHQLS